MELKEAFEEIKKAGYDIRYIHSKACQVDFDFLFDGYNGAFVTLIFTDNKLLLTDYANYEEILDDHEYEDIEKLCKKHDVQYIDYNIEKEYKGLKDLKIYEQCILDLRSQYSIDRDDLD